jgi:tRNA pseudouridine65 synthase
LYEDQFLVAVNKPTGLLVHKSPIDKHETRFALQIVRDQIGKYLYPIHRLDKPTSGVLIFALSQDMAKYFTTMFANGFIQKSYLAITRGYTPQSGLIDHPLTQMLDTQKQKKQKEKNITKESKEAQTQYHRLATVELPYTIDKYPTTRYSLVKLNPKTGRKHQLRRHLKHISHHIIGDTKHGRGEHNKFFRRQFNIHRLLLHAYEIRFIHPISKKEVYLKAELDDDFKRLFKEFKWNYI